MPLDFARLIALKRGVAHSAIFVFKRHRKEPESKQRQRIRHVIARNAPPVFRFDSRKFPVFLKARYVNDVHLAPLRMRRAQWSRPTIFNRTTHLAHCVLIRNLRPQPDAPRAIQRMSPLQTSDSVSQCVCRINHRIRLKACSSSPTAITSAAALAHGPDLLSDSVVDTIPIIAVIYGEAERI